MKKLYRCVLEEAIEQQNIDFFNGQFRIVVDKPHFINHKETVIQDKYWYMLTLLSGGYKIYKVLTKDNEVIHTSYVIHSRLKFCFMKKQDIEIGPCQTKEAYRGKGIYPFFLIPNFKRLWK